MLEKAQENLERGIEVALGEHWLVAGASGSGKTWFIRDLIRELFRMFPDLHIYILDTKNVGDFNDWQGHVVGDIAPPPLKQKSAAIQIWHPILEIPAQIEAWLAGIEADGHDGPCLVVIDELEVLCYEHPKEYSKGYRRLQKIGRGLPVTTITATQEMTEIPRQALSQARHIVRMRLGTDYDSRILDKRMKNPGTLIPGRFDSRGRPAINYEPRSKYGLWYGRTDRPGQAYHYDSKDEFFGRVAA